MAKVIFFIGPAGAGKSKICEKISKGESHFKHIHLDNLKGDHIKKIENGEQEILRYEERNDKFIYLIDVGAFFQYYIDISFWEKRRDQMICIYNNPEFCYSNYLRRSGKPRKSKDEYLKKEFCDKRELLYSLAFCKIISNKHINESIKGTLICIKKL